MAVKVQRPAVLESLPGENVWVFASGFFWALVSSGGFKRSILSIETPKNWWEMIYFDEDVPVWVDTTNYSHTVRIVRPIFVVLGKAVLGH